jgi:hypothetical protein
MARFSLLAAALYESGHMVYVRDESLQQLHDRVAAFIRTTEAGNR